MYMVAEKNLYEALMGKPEERRPRGKPRIIWQKNNKINLTEKEGSREGYGFIHFRIGTSDKLL